MSTRELFRWLRGLIGDLPVVTPRDPDPPFYDAIPHGPEHDGRRLGEAWSRVPPGAATELLSELEPWLHDLDRLTEAGHDLAYQLGVEAGEIEDSREFAARPTEQLEIALWRRWEPGELHGLEDAGVDVAGPDLTVYLPAPLPPPPLPPPPLPLLDLGTDDREPLPLLTAGPALPPLPQGAPVPTTPAVSEQSEHLSIASVATGAVLGSLAVVAVWFAFSSISSPHAPSDGPSVVRSPQVLQLQQLSQPEPLPLADLEVLTCPVPKKVADTSVPESLPPPPSRRRSSSVDLTKTGGVIVRRKGKAGTLVTARELAVDEEPLDVHVIDADVHSDVAIVMPLGEEALTIEIDGAVHE